MTVSRQQRGDGPGHGALHAGRRDVRRPDDLVPDARRRPIGDVVADQLQSGHRRSDGGRRRRGGRWNGGGGMITGAAGAGAAGTAGAVGLMAPRASTGATGRGRETAARLAAARRATGGPASGNRRHGGAGGARVRRGEGEGETGAGGATVATGGMHGGTGGAGPGATGGAGGSPSDAGVTPPPQPPAGCSCDFGSDAPGPGAFLFSLLGGGLAIRSRRGRKGSSTQAPRGAPRSC